MKTIASDARHATCRTAALTAAAALLSAAAAFAAPFAGDVTHDRFPDADSVIVDEIERVAYNPDGTYETTDESWTKMLTEKGRRSESSVSLSYSKRYGEAEIVFVKAIGEDGREREIDVASVFKKADDLMYQDKRNKKTC